MKKKSASPSFILFNFTMEFQALGILRGAKLNINDTKKLKCLWKKSLYLSLACFYVRSEHGKLLLVWTVK